MIKKILLILSIYFLIQGCITPKMNLQADVKKNANNYSAISIDFVFIFTEKPLEEIKKISALDWFIKKDQYKNDYAINDDIQILSFELTPDQNIQISKFKPNYNPLALVVFANYDSPGEHRVIINDYTNLKMEFKESDFLVIIEK